MTPLLRLAGLALIPAVLAGWIGSPALAQDAGPEPEAAAPAERPKPRRPPAPRPVKPAAKPEPKPADKAPPVQAAPAKPVWPEGASAVSEVYGDWTVNCARPQDAAPKPAASTPAAREPATCSLIQSQGDPKTGRRTFVFELRPPKDGRADGVILMPFGFAIEPGVGFKLDDTVLGKGAPYSFCGGDGCYVPISLPTLATDTMRTAATLTVSAQKPNETEPALIKLPLAGFAPAFDRMVGFGG